MPYDFFFLCGHWAPPLAKMPWDFFFLCGHQGPPSVENALRFFFFSCVDTNAPPAAKMFLFFSCVGTKAPLAAKMLTFNYCETCEATGIQLFLYVNFHFTCGVLNPWNFAEFQNVMKKIVLKFSFALYVFNSDSNFWISLLLLERGKPIKEQHHLKLKVVKFYYLL